MGIKQPLFINTRPAIDIQICQFIRKYVPISTVLAGAEKTVAMFQFDGKIFYLLAKNFLIDEALVWTQRIWFYKLSHFIGELRKNNYKQFDIFFPVPIFEAQEDTNMFVLLLLLVDRLAFLDSLSTDMFKSIMDEIMATCLGCLKEKTYLESFLDFCLQVAVNGQQRQLSQLDSFFNMHDLPSNLRTWISNQQSDNGGTRPSLSAILYAICNKQELTQRYTSTTSAPSVKFLERTFETLSEFEIYWSHLKFSKNVIILNGVSYLTQVPFTNKNCRVQKTRCWVFKRILKVDHFESRLCSLAILFVFINQKTDEIEVFEIGQAQRFRLNINFSNLVYLDKAMDLFAREKIFLTESLQIFLAPDLSWQDTWLLFEIQVMSLYHSGVYVQKDRVVNFEGLNIFKQVYDIKLFACYSWHVILVYLFWYMATYTKNVLMIYSWQAVFNRGYFLNIYHAVFASNPNANWFIDQLNRTGWFKNIQIRIGTSIQYFGAFQSPLIYRYTRRNQSHLVTRQNLCVQKIYCFSNLDNIQHNKFGNNSIVSVDDDWDLSNIDLTQWIEGLQNI